MSDELKKALKASAVTSAALTAATVRLNESIAKTEAMFKSYRFGVIARVALGEDRFLAWAKYDNQWGFFYEQKDEYEPLKNAPRHIRMQAVQHFHALLRQIDNALDKEIAKVDESIASVDEFTAEIKAFVASEKAKPKWNGFCPSGRHGLDYQSQPCDLCARELASTTKLETP